MIKYTREEVTEAKRMARHLIKDELKRAGVKISHVEASEITKAAKHLLGAEPSIYKKARTVLIRRKNNKRKIAKRMRAKK